MKPKVMVEDRENLRLVSLVRKIDEYLLQRQTAEIFGQQAESRAGLSERLPNGNLFVQKKLSHGLRIRAEIENDKQTVTLRIFLDPLRFNNWTKALGPVEFFYMDPFGVEVYFKAGKWAISIDKKVVPFKNTNEIYEMARIEVQTRGNARKLVRVA